ncbi:MAG TPA: M23 family metallopeptidase [Acidimicrobiales bacterium]|nr:M23 family metallopeptidase [Acidimicrobiales bacterium]
MSIRSKNRRAVVAAVLTITLCAATSPAAAQPPRFVPPVDAPISDSYRPPATSYGPGNRGIEYATRPGTAVGASAAGFVAFAGIIAYERYVSIDHEGGVRTTYSYLETIEVVAGQRVARGDVVGEAGDLLHFGARRFGLYIDPASLFESTPPSRARLVPVRGSPWT